MKTLILTMLFLMSGFVLQAQELTYPTKECEGAKTIPEGLTSWCDTKYYNACECKYERALASYENKKKKIASDLYGLNKNRDIAWKEYQNSMDEAQKFRDKLKNDNPNYEEDKAKALEALAEAKIYAKKAIFKQEEIDTLGKRIHGQQYGRGTTAMEADLQNIETSIVTTTEKKKVVTQEVAVTKPKIEETEKEDEKPAPKQAAQENNSANNNQQRLQHVLRDI